MNIKKIIKSPLVIFLLYCLLAIIFFGKWFFLTGQNRRYVTGDFYHYFASLYFYSDSIRNHTLPLWNQYVYQGLPMIARADVAFFYPINLLWIIIAAISNLSFTKLYLFYELYPVLHIALGGFFTFLLAKDFKISKLGSFLAGLIFMFSGSLIILVSGPPLLASAVWFPLILLYFRRTLLAENPHLRKKYLFLAILAMAFSHFGGYFQISFYYNIFGLVLFLIHWYFSGGKSPRDLIQPIKNLLGIIFSSILLYAIQLLPTLEFTAHSTRSINTLEAATFYGAVKPLDILNFVFPNFYHFYSSGSLINIVPIFAYFGFMVILLFILGLKSPKVKISGYFLLLLILVVLAALGGYASLYDYMVTWIPGLMKFRNIFKMLYLASMSSAIIAALGFDWLFSLKNNISNQLKSPIKKFIFITLSLLIFQIIIFYFRFSIHQQYLSDIFAVEAVGNSIALSLLFVAISSIIIYFSLLWNKTLAKILIFFIIFIDLSIFNQSHLINNSKINARNFLLNDNISVISLVEKDRDIFRVKYIGTGFGSYYCPEGLKIRNVDGYSSFVIDKFGEATNRVNMLGFSGQEFIDEISNAGVKYVVSDQIIQNSSLDLIQDDTITLENQKYYFKYVDEAHNYVNRPFGEKIYLYRNKSFRGMIDTSAQYLIDEFSDKEIKVSIDSDSERPATIKVPYYSGWNAYVNSSLVNIEKNNEGYISLNLPKGKSTLLLKFQFSPIYYIGAGISAMTLIFLGLYYFLPVRPRLKTVIANSQKIKG